MTHTRKHIIRPPRNFNKKVKKPYNWRKGRFNGFKTLKKRRGPADLERKLQGLKIGNVYRKPFYYKTKKNPPSLRPLFDRRSIQQKALFFDKPIKRF